METINKIKFVCYDNKGKTCDRYTIVFPGIETRKSQGMTLHYALSSNGFPFDPQGIGLHIESPMGNHLGEKVSFDSLPKDLRRWILSEVLEMNAQTFMPI